MSSKLPIKLNTYYQEILRQTQPLITNKDKTGILDNTQRSEQDQEQSGQLSFIIIGLLKLTEKLETLTNTVEALEQSLKLRPNLQTGTSSSTSAQPSAHIGSNFLTYNPPDK